MIAVAFTAVLVMLGCSWAAERPESYRATWRQRRAWRRERLDLGSVRR